MWANDPAQKHINVPDDRTPDHKLYFNIKDNSNTERADHEKGQARPRGVLIKFDTAEQTATHSTIYGWLWDENVTDLDEYRLACGVVHPLAFAAIDMSNTKAVGIKVLM